MTVEIGVESLERPLRVLLVEDDIGHADLIVRSLGDSMPSAEVTVARSLRDAEAELAHAIPDVAIVDVLLPDGSGAELLCHPPEAPGYPIVILTAHGDERQAVNTLKAGALNYVVKSASVFPDIANLVEMALREWRNRQQRLEAEAALKESEERFRNLIEGSIQGILITQQRQTLFVNQACADMLGYDSPTELMALDSSELLFAAHERERLAQYSQARMNGEFAPTHYEFEGLRKNGDTVSLQNFVRPVIWAGQRAVQSVLVDISDRKRAEAALQHQAELEEMITNISARFINLTSREIDDGINDALREISEFSDVDRAYAALFSTDFERFTLAFEWCRDGVESLRPARQDVPCSLLPWMTQKHRSGQLAYVPTLDDLPEEAQAEKSILESLGVKSLVSIPLVSKGEIIGFFGFDSVRDEKLWTEEIISILTIVGESLANAIDRQQSEESLRESEQRFKDFADVAADWFWEMGPDLRYTYLSERYHQVLGVSSEQHVGLSVQEIFTGRVDDQDAWRTFLEKLHSRAPIDVELAWVRGDGASKFVRLVGRPRFDEHEEFQGYRGVGRDITEAHQMSAQIAHQASHDALTGLVNRREFERRLARAVRNAQDNAAQYVLGYIDLDQFKIINDVAGHAAGDELLRQVAALLNAKIRGRDTLARLGGDEFTLLLENCPLEKALEIADGMLEDFRAFRFPWGGRSFEIGLSIGLISVNVHAESASRELAKADLACYTAKRLGRNRVHVYRMEDSELARRQSEIRRIADLRDALANDQFRLYAQPILPLAGESEEPFHYELLLRMVDRAGDIVMPEDFIPAAERYGLMALIDRWVVRTALRTASRWPVGTSVPAIAINLSGNSLNDDSLLDFVLEEFETSGFSTARVCFEITETAAINNFERASEFINRMRAAGCRFALDDFGSGVSSFTYLKHLPVDYLKIDGSFVRDMADEPLDRAMVAAIHQVGRIMGIRTIAECADTDVVVEQLRELEVDYVQGDAVGRVMPLDDLLEPAVPPGATQAGSVPTVTDSS